MILSTTHSVPNREITAILGIARGGTVRTRNIGRDIVAGLKKIAGGEITCCHLPCFSQNKEE